MRKALKLVPRPEEQFIERYERLHAWALTLTNGNEDQADDLVHDAFIQFTLRRTNLGTIQNTDGYLHRMLRNMFLSQVRRSASLQQLPDSMADYDSAELGLRIIDPQTEMQIADELRRICRYASERKETYKGGSVLILRFFHGYYLDEIAQLLSSPMASIYSFLKIARREARLYLNDPDSLRMVVTPTSPEIPDSQVAEDQISLLTELRNSIFASRRGACLEQARLDRAYAQRGGEKFECAELAHLVSCPICLDQVNRMLELPLLTERYPTDTMGRHDEARDHDGGDDDGPEGGGSGASPTAMLKRKHSRRFKEVHDHRPQELRVSVNGFVLGSQKIGQELNKQTISVNIDERIGFVEIFSEQGVRLLFCDVEQPVDGDIEQRAEARFSDGRKLELAVDFRSAWPTLHVLYRDPALKAIGAFEADSNDLVETVGEPEDAVGEHRFREHGGGALSLATGLWRLIKEGGFWLRPGTVTALLTVLLVAAVLLVYRRAPAPAVTAADLLQKAAVAEDALAANKNHVLHRTLTLEEKKSNGELIAQRRIEIWQSAEKGITARRLYDEKGSLIAGDWRRADGVQTLYHHGARPQLQIAPEKRGAIGSTVTFDNAWQLSPSAKEFDSLIAHASNAQVEERPNVYVITYSVKSADGSSSVSGVSTASGSDRISAVPSVVVRAVLVLNRPDLHAIEQRLVVRQGNETREFKFTETAFEQKASSAVAPTVFDPEPELLSSIELETRNSKPETELAPETRNSTPSIATAGLEVEVVDLLNNAGAFMGEQISVQRTGKGKLQVNALVETDKRKTELLNALAPVKGNPAVKINIETVAEAQAREARAKKGKQTTGGVTVDTFTATENTSPVYNDLRKKFDEAGARAFADRILRRSQQARRHALAAKQLSDRFSQADLASLTPAERAKWLGLIAGHAGKFLAESESIRRELQTVFPNLAGGGASPRVATDKEIQAAVRELYNLSVACDEDLRGSFALLTGAGGSAEVKTAKFWRTLNNAAATARSLQSAK